jgi:hypothetical protein
MSYLYTRKNYDILMGKPNIGRYVKKQLSVTSSDLHDQRGKWEEAGMKLPAPLAAFHIGKPSLCTFWNHAKGAGCKREKDGKKCDRDHKCMWCGSTTHGAYMRNSHGSSAGVFQCPFYEGIRVELQSLGVDASIADLDDFVEELRVKGVPPEISNASMAPSQPAAASNPRLPAKSNAPVSSTSAQTLPKDQHVPVGGIPVNRTKNKKSKKDPSATAPAASAPPSFPSSAAHPSEASHASAPNAIHHPAPISKPNSIVSASHPANPIHHNSSNNHTGLAHLQSPIQQGSVASQLFNPNPPSSLFDSPEYGEDGPFDDHSYATGDSVSATADMGSETSSVHSPRSSLGGSASSASGSSMHLIMHPMPYTGLMELRIHTPLIRTPSSLLYVATHSHSWMVHPTEVIVKLSSLSVDPMARQKQQEKLESEFRAYSIFGRMGHPNLLTIIGIESMIESGAEHYALVAMEKADFNLAGFFSEMLPHLPLFQQHTVFKQQMALSQPGLPPAISPLYRSLCNQLINTYLLLHLHDRYHQRCIDPSNIYVSSSSLASYSSLGIEKETPTLKICDFNFYRPSVTAPSPSDPSYRGFLSPEAARSKLDFGTLSHLPGVNTQFDGKASDLFSIGCVLYFICSGGNALFASDAERDDVRGRTAFLKRHYVDKSDPMLLDLINRLTLPIPGDRPPLDVIRHHPALWSPQAVIDFISMVSTELERPASHLSGLISDIVGSDDFFTHAFPKSNNWKDHVLPSWISSWNDWARGNITNRSSPDTTFSTKEIDYRSIRVLLRHLSLMAEHLPGGLIARVNFGVVVTRRLHYLIIALWSHLQQIGTFDEHHHFSFIS